MEPENNSTNINILVVDDDADLGCAIVEYFQSCPFNIDYARNGKEAICYIKSKQYELIVSDVLMPEMDGLELTIYLAKNKSKSKLLMMSGGGRLSKDYYLDMSHEFGAKHTISKPFMLEELKQKIRQILLED